MFHPAAGSVSPLTAQLRQFNLSIIGIRTGSAPPAFSGSLTGLPLSSYPTGLETTEAKLETFWEDWKTAEHEEHTGLGISQAALRLKNELGAQAAILEALHNRQQQLLCERVDEVNEVLSRLAWLNANAGACGALQRKRSRLLQRLAGLTGPINVEPEEPSGPCEPQAIRVYLGETVLVQGDQHNHLTFDRKGNTPENSSTLMWNDACPFHSGQGQIAGLISLEEILLPSLQAGLASSRAVLERVLEDSRLKP